MLYLVGQVSAKALCCTLQINIEGQRVNMLQTKKLMHGKRRRNYLLIQHLSVETVDQDYQNNYTVKGIWTQEMRTDWVAMMDHQTTTP